MATRLQEDFCAEFVLPIAQLKEWLAQAQVGQSLLYCHAPGPIYGETWSYVGELARAGRVHPSHPKSTTCEGFRAFQIRVLALEAKEEPKPSHRRAEADDDEAQTKIRQLLRRAANFGRRCPSNPDLAKAAGLSTPAQAAWRISKLQAGGAFRIVTIKDGPEAGWRTVIFPDGRHTELPPSGRAIAAQREDFE
jgi:hypothetical protein